MPKMLAQIFSINNSKPTTPPPAYEESHPPMSSTREPKAVGGQMTEGVGVSRVKPKESKLEKFKRYVTEDAEKQAQGDIWGGKRGMGGHG